MPNDDPSADRPVLIAYDGSDHAKEAIGEAGRQLRTPREAIVVSVWQPLESIPFWGAPLSMVPAQMADQVKREAEEIAAEGATIAAEAGFEPKAVVVEGFPIWRRIVDAAKERNAGIIVMGSHGRSGASYVAMGSVATAVAHHAPMPVLICRAAADR